MEASILEGTRWGENRATGLTSGLMEADTQEGGSRTKSMGRVDMNGSTAEHMKAAG